MEEEKKLLLGTGAIVVIAVALGTVTSMLRRAEKEIPPSNGTVLYTVSGWVVYEALDGRGRVYRYSLPWSVVEYWIETDGVHRLQLVGETPLGAWPEHHIFEVGSHYYDTYVAMFAYMDDGCPEGYKSEGWWFDQIGYCAYHPEAPGLCIYSPYTWIP